MMDKLPNLMDSIVNYSIKILKISVSLFFLMFIIYIATMIYVVHGRKL